MSDDERRALARTAGDGDFGAAVALVMMIMRGSPPLDPMAMRYTEAQRLEIERTETRSQLVDLAARLRELAERAGLVEHHAEGSLRDGGVSLEALLLELAATLDSEQVVVHFDKPPTDEDLRARKLLGVWDVFYGGRPDLARPDRRDTLVRWLLVHAGKIIYLCQDPPGFEAVEPAQRVRDLEAHRDRLVEALVRPDAVGAVAFKRPVGGES